MTLSLYDLNNDKADRILATNSTHGLMSKNDKTKLDTIENGANNYTHPATHATSMITGLSNVAVTGNYTDLMNRPTIPTVLPANGGNSDTVDGKHAEDFLNISGGTINGNIGIQTSNITNKLAIKSTSNNLEDVVVIKNNSDLDVITLSTNGENGAIYIKDGISKQAVIMTNNNGISIGSVSNDDVIFTHNSIELARITNYGIKTNLVYKDKKTITVDGTKGNGLYSWIRIKYTNQNLNEPLLKLQMTHSMIDNDSVPNGNCKFEICANGHESQIGNLSAYGWYSESGNTEYGQFITNISIEDLNESGSWIYFKVLTGLTYLIIINSGSIDLNSIEYNVTIPTKSWNISKGFNTFNSSVIINSGKIIFEDSNNKIENNIGGIQVSSTKYGILSAKNNSYVAGNAYYDGVNWQRYDNGKGSSLLSIAGNNSELLFYKTVPGTGIINWETENIIWHSGNMGHNSNLSADKLDGKHANEFLSKTLGDTLSTPFISTYGFDSSKASFIGSSPSLNYIGFGSNGAGSLKMGVVNDYNGTWKDQNVDLYLNTKKVWHEGNDGSGSTLDSDLLDGFEANDISGIPCTGYFATANYSLIATLPVSNNATYDKLFIQLIGGTQDSSTTNYDWMILANRNGFNYSYTKQGSASNRSNFKVVAYKQNDNSVNIYLVATGYYAGIISIKGLFVGGTQSTIKLGAWNSTLPAGTILFDSHTTPANASSYTHPETHPATMITGLSNVATSGNFSDLTGKVTGSSNFVGNGLERTIPHGLGVTPSAVFVTPNNNPNGMLGEMWIRYDTINIYVGNNGTYTDKFCWVAFR